MPMDANEARAEAQRFTEKLFSRRQFAMHVKVPERLPHTLAELVVVTMHSAPMALACEMLGPIDAVGLDFIKAVMSTMRDPSAVTDFIARRFEAAVEDPAKLHQAIDEAVIKLERPGTLRRAIQPLLDEWVPKGPPGRPIKIGFEQRPAFLREVDSAMPLARTTLNLSRISKGRLSSGLEILKEQHPDNAHLVTENVEFVESAVARLMDPQRKFGPRVRIKKLAAALAGRQRGLEPSYAESIADQARRAADSEKTV